MLAALLPAMALGASVPPPMMVFGHKIPDTDAICAALAYVWELEERGIPAKAYRLGNLNRETEYVLKQVGMEMPELLTEDLAPGTPVAVVDTQNPAELPEGITKAGVHSIIDHHKMSVALMADWTKAATGLDDEKTAHLLAFVTTQHSGVHPDNRVRAGEIVGCFVLVGAIIGVGVAAVAARRSSARGQRLVPAWLRDATRGMRSFGGSPRT